MTDQPKTESIILLTAILEQLTHQAEQLTAILQTLQASHTQTQTIDEALSRLASTYQQQPAPAVIHANSTITILVDTITYSMDENGKPAYKARGGMYRTYGVRIWPEMLPVIGIDPANLQPGPNPITPRLMIAETTETGSPRKIVGLV